MSLNDARRAIMWVGDKLSTGELLDLLVGVGCDPDDVLDWLDAAGHDTSELREAC